MVFGGRSFIYRWFCLEGSLVGINFLLGVSFGCLDFLGMSILGYLGGGGMWWVFLVVFYVVILVKCF